jgi:hypothetical protein
MTAETVETSTVLDIQSGFTRSIAGAVLFIDLLAATTRGVKLCLLKESAATQIMTGTTAESSTEFRELTPELTAKLDAMLDEARHAIIEDGMYNPINERLPDLVAQDFNTVIPALLSAIEAKRTTPMVAAEVLKELGGVRNVSSHGMRRWVLERALRSPWPFTRDGAGLGLARLSDPTTMQALRRAVENEPNAQIKADLQLVVDEMTTNGTALADDH